MRSLLPGVGARLHAIGGAGLLALLLVSACGEKDEGPSDAVVERIEAKLARDPCVGSIDRWHREYAFTQAVNQPLDPNEIAIWLTDTRLGGGALGRVIRKTVEEWPVDDRPIKVVSGIYNIQQDLLTIEHCGPNFGPQQPPRVVS